MNRLLLLCGAAALLTLCAPEARSQTDPATLKRDAIRNMTAGRFGEAISLLDQFLQLKPGDAEGYRLRGRCYQNRGRLENAVDDLRKAVSLDPANRELAAETERTLGTLRVKVEGQIDGYKRELARNPGAADPYLQIARAYRSINDLRAAEQWYDDYVRRTKAPPEEILRYCEVLAAANHMQKGESVLLQYVQTYPRDAELQSRLGYFLLWQGKYAAAERAFQKALAIAPSLAGARQGLDETRSRAAAGRQPAAARDRTPVLYGSPVERFSAMLQANPGDEEARFSLVQALSGVDRFEEAFQQLDSLSLRLADSVRVADTRSSVTAARDSVTGAKIADNLEILKERPDNKPALLRLAGYYGDIGRYQEALSCLTSYLAGLPDTSALDVRFRYAQFAAWGKQFDSALGALNPLLKLSPGNIDYQLLFGQIAVWGVRDLDQGVRYLNNVLRRSPSHMPALLTMSSALALQRKFPAAKQYLERARAVDAGNKDLRAAQAFLDEALRAESERSDFALLETARSLTAAGDCPGAIKKYEEYFLRVAKPVRPVMIAYADVQSCAKNYAKAIQICDELLDEEYDFDVALMKGKNLLWSGDSLGALSEFKRLRAERPDDFGAGLYLGEALQGLGRIDEARDVYQGLLDRGAAGDDRTLVVAHMKYLPATGLFGSFASFPTRLAFSPPVTFYSDNQEFSTATYGGRLELGVTGPLAVGFAYTRSALRSSQSSRLYEGVKGQLFFRFSNRLTASGSFGALSSPGKNNVRIGDAALVYEKPGTLRISATAEGSDAAVLLYTPYLIDMNYEARIYRLAGTYLTSGQWRVQGYYKVVSVSDGNTGLELQLRLGRKFFDELFLGYEYLYTDFRRQPPYVPFTNRGRQLYYAPQNLESHFLWAEWQPEQDQTVNATLRAKVGYLPAYRASVREIGGELEHHLTPSLGISAAVSIGNTYRNDGSYSYVSVGASIYWTAL